MFKKYILESKIVYIFLKIVYNYVIYLCVEEYNNENVLSWTYFFTLGLLNLFVFVSIYDNCVSLSFSELLSTVVYNAMEHTKRKIQFYETTCTIFRILRRIHKSWMLTFRYQKLLYNYKPVCPKVRPISKLEYLLILVN